MNFLKFILFLLFFYAYTSLFSQNKYPVGSIPESLKKNAKAVIREKNIVFEIHNEGSAIEKVKYAITVLNDEGIEDSYFLQLYDRFRKVRNFNGALYNARGERIRKFSNLDVLDFSAVSGYSIYEDNRIKAFNPKYRTVPFTIEYSFEIVYNGLLIYPMWVANEGPEISVEHTSYTILLPERMNFRYLEKNLPSNATISSVKGVKTYFWECKLLSAIRSEPYGPPFLDFTPVVFAGPSDFSIDEYPGNFETWQNFGEWVNSLNKGRDILSDETVQKVNDLIKKARNDYEKVRIIYKYVQNRTRYVSIQIGIGGWQPIDASTVDRLGYGDCKALVNYTKALLKAVGIDSYYTLVNAGSNAPNIIHNFPSLQFNHAILSVPMKSDTIWLECTNQRFPCGYIGAFTDDRSVLLVTDSGGKIMHTRSYSGMENARSGKLTLNIDDSGNAHALMNNGYSGVFFDQFYNILFQDDYDRKKALEESLPLSNFQVLNFQYSWTDEMIPKILESAEISIPQYVIRVDESNLLSLNPIFRFKHPKTFLLNRSSDVLIRRDFSYLDTVIVNIPNGFLVKGLSEPIHVKSKFGEYSSHAEVSGCAITYTRYFMQNKGRFPAEDYAELNEFYEEIAIADENAQAILIEKSRK